LYLSFKPTPSNIIGIHFSSLRHRVASCLAPPIYSVYSRCFPGDKASKAIFKGSAFAKANDSTHTHTKKRCFIVLFYSHSIVAGGLELISYTTLLTPFTLFIISLDTFCMNSYGKCTQSAVIPSVLSTALRATHFS